MNWDENGFVGRVSIRGLTAPISQNWLANTIPTVRLVGEKCFRLQIVIDVQNIAVLVAESRVTGDPLGEIIFHLDGVDASILFQQAE